MSQTVEGAPQRFNKAPAFWMGKVLDRTLQGSGKPKLDGAPVQPVGDPIAMQATDPEKLAVRIGNELKTEVPRGQAHRAEGAYQLLRVGGERCRAQGAR